MFHDPLNFFCLLLDTAHHISPSYSPSLPGWLDTSNWYFYCNQLEFIGLDAARFISQQIGTRWPCVRVLGNWWFILWLVVYMVPSHQLDQKVLSIEALVANCRMYTVVVFKIRTICHARDLLKLSQSCKQLCLLCSPRPMTFTYCLILGSFETTQEDNT